MADQQVTVVLDIITKMDKAQTGIRSLQKELQNLKLPKDLDNSFKNSFANLESIMSRYKSQLDKGFQNKNDVTAFAKTGKQLDAELTRLSKSMTELTGKQIDFKVDSSKLKEAERNLQNLINKQNELGKTALGLKVGSTDSVQSLLKELQTTAGNTKAGDAAGAALSKLSTGNIDEALKKIKELEAAYAKLRSDSKKSALFGTDQTNAATTIQNIITAIQTLGNDFTQTDAKINQTKKDIENIRAEQLSKVGEKTQEISQKFEHNRQSITQANGALQDYARTSQSMGQQLKDLQTSTQYFFSLRNMINLFKRGVREAVQSVKELDAAMTETAVVTKFDVGDLWKMLPDYTKIANDLGATTQGAYETMTLYFQQGLDTQAAFEIGSETMKMARIAGLEYAEATDMMTAALRGFNMELNNVSAQHINDVYSNLAAKTASNTEELGTAMQRTASIAHSAGMSFEGTTAFLAQAIETTREPAENLGTAMKTIIARFQELKENPLEMAEVDGEEVSYNKVDTALQSIGVSLKDANGQFRDLDKVFLEISQKWDSLTQTQQRYIATTAAGSRQQSRFIAMMSNYDRTVELMNYANNSAGASNEQFGKTMESLEAKMNKLHNAWQQFLMGIANDKLIKGFVDRLTQGITIVNKLINSLTKFDSSGIAKSILSLSMAFMGLKVAGRGINTLIGKAGGLVNPTTPMLGGRGSGEQPTKLQATITNPIVSAIREVVAAIRQEQTTNNKNNTIGTLQDYKNAQGQLRNLIGLNDRNMLNGSTATFALGPKSIKYSDVSEALKGLSENQQREIMGTFPGLQRAMQASTLGIMKNSKVSSNALKVGTQITNDIIKGMNKGTISVDKGLSLLRNTTTWGQEFGGQFSESALKEIEQMNLQRATEAAKQKYINAQKAKHGEDYQVSQEELDKRQKDFIAGGKRLVAQGKFAEEQFTYTKYDQLADKIGKVGSGFATAGQSVQQFGLFLSNIGLEGVGNALMRIGTAVSSLGMAFNGFGRFAGNFSKRWADVLAAAAKISTTGLKGMAQSGSAFASAFTAGINPVLIGAAIVAAVVGAIALIKNHLDKKAKEAGEEVSKNFEDGFTKTEEKINGISSYQDRFNQLSKGVDEFGHNVSLSTEEYDEYLTISRELSELSPSLIAGYNAEGQAILKKGEALDEVISKLEEEKKLALESYTSDDSIDKLIKAYRTSDVYKDHHRSEKISTGEVTGAFNDELDSLKSINAKANLDFDVKDAIEQLSGSSVSSLSSLSGQQLSFVAEHYNDILNLIEEENGTLDEEVKDGFKNAFGNLSGALADVKTEGQPIIEAMQRWMGAEKIDAAGIGLGEEFGNSFNQGLDAIMTTGLTSEWQAEDYKQALREYSKEWKTLGGATSEYTSILEQASSKQEDYLNNIGTKGATEKYQTEVESLATQLDNLADKYKGTGKAGQIFAEQCVQQANALRNYATEGALSLGEALNILSGKFTEARGAKERFDKATEGGDYYTAAEGFRSIAETVLDEKNSAGDGSLAAWTGAEALLGQNFVDSAKDWSEVQAQVEKVNKLFDDGVEGVYNFNDMLVEAVNSGKDLSGLGEVVDGAFHFDFDNVDNLKQYADLLGVSEDVLVGMIDKSRQFMAFNAGNNKQIRQALEQSGQSMIGQTYGDNGKTNLYMAESSFREEAYRQGIRGDDYTKTTTDLQEEQNVQLLTVDSLTAKSGDGLGIDNVLKDIGLQGTDKNLENTVSALTKMGFSLDEQKQILTSDGLKLADGEVSEEQIEKAYQEQEFAVENPTVAGIADNTGVIASAATAILASMGIITDQTKQDIENSTSDETIKGYLDSLSKEGEGFSDSTSRNEARANVQSQIDDYNETISLLQQGVASGNESLQPYIDQLTTARDQLQEGLDNEAEQWESKLSEASNLVKNIGTEAEQSFLSEKAVDIGNIFKQEDITAAATALRQLEEEGNLSYSTMSQLATEFLNLRQADLGNLSIEGLDNLCTTLGLTKDDATALLQTLQSPFVLQGRLEGQDLVDYIKQCDTLTETDKTILLNADLTGDEKVSAFIENINEEFGNGSEKTKKVILEAEAKLANGDQQGAEQLLAEAGFNQDEVKEITERLSITVNGTIANPGEVQKALTDQLNGMNLEAEAKARISAKLEIKNQAKAKDQTATVNYKKGNQAKADNQNATVNYKKGTQDEPDDQTATVNYSLGSVPSIPDQYVNIYPRLKGSGTYTVTASGAEGFNNNIKTSSLPTFGSAAKGTRGKIGPKGMGGLTLTGEKGFEIAWLPNENKSMILGASGPQMLQLPSNAVVYNHEQSKKIIKQKAIPAGSSAEGTLPKRGGGSTTTGNGRTTSNNGGRDDKVTGKEEKNVDNAAKVIAKAGWVQAWWENMTRRIDATQRRVDNSLSLFEKKIKTFGTTVTSIKSTVDAYKKNLNHSIALNKNEVNQAKYELKQLTNPNSWYNRKEVSYEETTGDKKETKKMTIKLANYIKYNQQEGTYEIRQDMLDKIGLKGWTDGNGKKHPANQSLAQAIKDAAEKEINDRNSKLKTAEDNIKKAQEALEKLSNDIYETFYKWEKSLNKVYILSKKLEMLNSKLSISSAKAELQFSKMEAGVMTAAQGLSRIRTELSNQETILSNKATASKENLSATKKAFQDSLTVQPYLSNLLKNPDSTEAKNDLLAAKKAFTFLDTVNLSGDNFDYNKALSYLNTQQISKDEYDAIKGVLDGIFDKQKNYLDAQEQSYQSINEIYQTMEEYQSFITDFEKDLLSGIEEQAEDQVKKLDKLNSSLSKAYKDLIDEVKQNLDERRKQEDNAKTESDIAKKQQRLSMLRADTSGGHAVEIAQLEKEIADAQQNYQRSLEDQLIEKLQHQGDEAEKQRQHQIDLLNIQNEIARETGSNLAQVNEWLKNPTSIAQHYEDIKAAWLANKGYDKATDHEKEQLEQQFEVDFAKYQGYSEQLKSYETMIKDLDDIENQVNTIATNVSMDRPTYTAKDMKAQGYSAYSLKLGGYNAQQLRDAGYTPQEIKKAGYTAEQFAAGYKSIMNNPDKSATEKATARQQGISAMHQAGYSNNDIAKQFGAQSTMQTLNASGKTVQSALGNDKNATAKYLQTQIVNKGGKNISQSDMEGVQVNIVTPDKKTVLAAIKGNYAYGHYGSTLYAQKWDSKTGTLTGTPAKYSIGGMTPEVMKAAGWEGMAALEYAIKTQQWGSIINKKFQQLTAAAGINGKEYTLGAKGHNWSASVGGDGLIYQNVKEGVAKWNPATGKTWVENYNKQHFIEVAKRNNGPSREYAQVLKAKGITKYATGGLADFTGPAWLDGTPSKPELVLNAQDTKNFVALKDVLSKAIGSTHAISNEYGGDTTFEININVDHIANDYDVDKMAERVKKIIVKDSSYRNVTQVRKFR